MSARDVIAKWLASHKGHLERIPYFDGSDAILSALSAAGYAVVSTGTLHKALQDAFQAGFLSCIHHQPYSGNSVINEKHEYCDKALAEILTAAKGE